MSRVILVTPDYHCGVVESAGTWPNLGFVYIAGELRKNVTIQVRLRDQQFKAGLRAAFHLKWNHDGSNDSGTTTN